MCVDDGNSVLPTGGLPTQKSGRAYFSSSVTPAPRDQSRLLRQRQHERVLRLRRADNVVPQLLVLVGPRGLPGRVTDGGIAVVEEALRACTASRLCMIGIRRGWTIPSPNVVWNPHVCQLWVATLPSFA